MSSVAAPYSWGAMPFTILVIDDDPSLLEMASELLASDGHRPLTASSGRDGLAQAQRGARGGRRCRSLSFRPAQRRHASATSDRSRPSSRAATAFESSHLGDVGAEHAPRSWPRRRRSRFRRPPSSTTFQSSSVRREPKYLAYVMQQPVGCRFVHPSCEHVCLSVRLKFKRIADIGGPGSLL